jgi:hypothetical protein
MTDERQEVPADSNADGRKTLAAEQVRWEVDKMNAKRRLLEEVILLVQHDRTANASVSRIVESMATVAEQDPASFWRDRSSSVTSERSFNFPLPPFPPFPPFPFPPFPPIGVPLPTGGLPFGFPFPPPPPPPWDVFGQVIDLIKAEKAMIQDLLTKLLS